MNIFFNDKKQYGLHKNISYLLGKLQFEMQKYRKISKLLDVWDIKLYKKRV